MAWYRPSMSWKVRRKDELSEEKVTFLTLGMMSSPSTIPKRFLACLLLLMEPGGGKALEFNSQDEVKITGILCWRLYRFNSSSESCGSALPLSFRI